MQPLAQLLVVEDEPLVAETIVAVLKDEYEVSTAPTVADAIRQLRDIEFNLVLLDCLLPDGDAAEIYRSRRSTGSFGYSDVRRHRAHRNLLGSWPAIPRQAFQHRGATENVARRAHLSLVGR